MIYTPYRAIWDEQASEVITSLLDAQYVNNVWGKLQQITPE
jgi:hypothetical protein